MDDYESTFREAAEEIRRLRRDNELLRARVDTMDLFATLLFTKPFQVEQGMSPDIAWKLEKTAQEIAAERSAKPQAIRGQ